MTAGLCPDPDPRTLLCTKCGRACEPRRNGWQHVRELCGAPMRLGETCARTKGHATGGYGQAHRTRYAMDCQMRDKSGRGLRASLAA